MPGLFGRSSRILFGGTKWTDTGVAPSGTFWCLGDCGNGILLAGEWGGNGHLWRSVNLGVNWTDKGQLFGQTELWDICPMGNGVVLIGTGPGSKIIRSLDDGDTWPDDLGHFGTDPLNSRVISIANYGSGIAVASSYIFGELHRTINYGDNWVNLGVLDPTEAGAIGHICLGGGVGLIATWYSTKIYKTINYGASFSYKTVFPGASWSPNFCDLGGGIVLVGTFFTGQLIGDVRRSVDAGDNWVNVGQPVPGAAAVFAFANLGNGIVVCGTDPAGHIGRSVNKGLTWKDLGPQFGQSAIMEMLNLGNNIVIAASESPTPGEYGKILRSVK